MDCVARGELPPTVFQDKLAGYVQARGAAYAEKLAGISTRFFSGMVQISAAYSQELAEMGMPGVTVPPLPPPQYDPTDPYKWFQQLTEYAGQLSANAVRIYQSLMERVAAGDVSPGQLQETSASYVEHRLPEHLRHLGNLYFDLLNQLNDLRASSEEEFLTGILSTAKEREQETPFVLNLVAPLGQTASASLSLANTKDEPALTRCMATDVRRADGVGPAFRPQIMITPESLQLQPGEEASMVVSLELSEGSYDPNALYIGALRIVGHGEPDFEVPLHIMATSAGTASRSTTASYGK